MAKVVASLLIEMAANVGRLKQNMDDALLLVEGTSKQMKSAATSAMESIGAKAETIGRKFESIGVRVGGLGAAVQGGLSRLDLDLVSVTSASIDAEQALYGIATTAGKSGEEARAAVSQWSRAVDQIAVATNKGQAEVILAFQDLVAKGISEQDALRMLEPIGRAATAAGAEIRDIASSANAAFQSLGIAPERLGKALDIMAQAGKAGAFELRDMAQYFDLLTVKSELLGSKGEAALGQLAAAAQIARKGAGDAGTAANNLANFLDKLSAPVTAKAFEKFGLNLADEVKKGLASGDLIGYFGQLVQDVTKGDAAKVSALFSDIQAKNFIAPLIQNLEEYKRIRNDALSASGVVDQDFQTATQSMAATFEQLRIAGQAAMTSSQVVQSLLSGLKSLAQWAAEHPNIIAMLGIGSAAAVAGGAVIVGIGAVLTSIGTLTTALTAMSVFLAANPIVLAIMGVAVAGMAVYAYWDEITAGIGKAWDAVKGFFSGIGAWLDKHPVIKAMLGIAVPGLGVALYWKEITAGIATAYAKVKATLAQWADIGSNLVAGIIDGIKKKARDLLSAVTDMAKALPDWAKQVLGIKSPSTVMMEVGQQAVQGLVIGLESGLPAVQAMADKLAEVVVVAPSKMPRNASGQYKSAADAARDGSGFGGGVSEFLNSIAPIADQIKDVTVRAFHSMEDAFAKFARTGKLSFKDMTASILDDLSRMAARLASQQILRAVIGMFGGPVIPSAMGNAFSGGRLLAFANGGAFTNSIVSAPMAFPLGLMGERGPEAIMPLTRGPDGRLGISGQASVTNVVVNVIESPGRGGETRERQDNGTRVIDVLVDRIRGAIANDIARGSGAVPASMERVYGLNRAAGGY